MTDRKPSAEAMVMAKRCAQMALRDFPVVRRQDLDEFEQYVGLALDAFAARYGHERGLVHDEPLADSVTGGQAILDAERRGEERMRERAAQCMDDRALGCRITADNIQRDWMGPDIPCEDRQANARDRIEHLQRIPLYEALARVIRDLPLTPDPEAGQ